ncbi:MAG: hypothetical protein N2035_02290 [Chthoniobacterales bacterium]|nr:hypothetical protein [Chthoniobacterales bacterium]
MNKTFRSDYDLGWKEALQTYLREFLDLFFPPIASEIAWDKPITWLSQETLPPPSSLAESPPHPKGIVDALLRVHLRNGHPHHHLLLLEIQAHPHHSFPLRMFLYFSSLLQQYKDNLLPAAVLTDLNPNWKPSEFHYQIFDCQLSFRFPICKLLELEDRCKNSSSFAAMVVRLQLAALRFRGKPALLLQAPKQLFSEAKALGWKPKQLADFLRVMGPMKRLPKLHLLHFKEFLLSSLHGSTMRILSDLEELLYEEAYEKAYEEAYKKAYKKAFSEAYEKAKKEIRTEAEKKGLERGLAKGLEKGRMEGRAEGRAEGQKVGELIGEIRT